MYLGALVGAAALYVGYTMYSQSAQPIATNVVRSTNAWTTTGSTVAIQNTVVSEKPDVDPLTQLPCKIVTYSNGYQERLQTFGGKTRTKTNY
jgi:hypothetical protein